MEEAKRKLPIKIGSARPANFYFSILDLTEGLIEELDGFVDVRLGGVQHGSHADGVSVEAALADEQSILARALHHLGGGFGSWLFGLAVFDQFERLHQSHAAHVADKRMLGLQFFQLAAEVFADHVRILQQIFFFNQFDGGLGRYAGNGIAAERRDVRALETAGNFRRGHGQSYGYTIAHAFRAGDHVWNDFPILDAEPFLAGASPAGLHLIGDEERAILFDDLENNLEVLLRRSDEPADALNGFGDECVDIAAGAGLNETFDV